MNAKIDEQAEMLLNLCKLLLDAERLQILGVLARRRCSKAMLAVELPDVGKLGLHLHRLQSAGLLRVYPEQEVELYEVDTDRVQALKKQLFARPETDADQTPAAKELAKFIKSDVLQQLPVRPAHLILVLAWLVEKFQLGVEYAEREVNELLKGHKIDHVTLRRLLVDHGLLARQAGIYRRVERP